MAAIQTHAIQCVARSVFKSHDVMFSHSYTSTYLCVTTLPEELPTYCFVDVNFHTIRTSFNMYIL